MRPADFRNQYDRPAIVIELTRAMTYDFLIEPTAKGATITAPDGRVFDLVVRSGKTFWEASIERVCYTRFTSHDQLNVARQIIETTVRLAALGFNTGDMCLSFHKADWIRWSTTLANQLLDELRTHGRFRMEGYMTRRRGVA